MEMNAKDAENMKAYDSDETASEDNPDMMKYDDMSLPMTSSSSVLQEQTQTSVQETITTISSSSSSPSSPKTSIPSSLISSTTTTTKTLTTTDNDLLIKPRKAGRRKKGFQDEITVADKLLFSCTHTGKVMLYTGIKRAKVIGQNEITVMISKATELFTKQLIENTLDRCVRKKKRLLGIQSYIEEIQQPKMEFLRTSLGYGAAISAKRKKKEAGEEGNLQ